MDHLVNELCGSADRRSALRQDSRIPNLSVVHAAIGNMTAIVLDISREGFRLLLPAAVPCGDEILILPPEGTDLLKIRATVVRQSIVEHDHQSMFDCGAEVADTAAWRKHAWFLTLRTGGEKYEAAQHRKPEVAGTWSAQRIADRTGR